MSTIASPRPSIALSRRTSASTDTTVRSQSISRGPVPPTQRRNRAALRDYYNLKDTVGASATSSKETLLGPEESAPESELDKPGFNAENYVRDLLAKEGLEGILRVEAGLVSDIRGFDGERKALVYDNYSKLIGATDTVSYTHLTLPTKRIV